MAHPQRQPAPVNSPLAVAGIDKIQNFSSLLGRRLLKADAQI